MNFYVKLLLKISVVINMYDYASICSFTEIFRVISQWCTLEKKALVVVHTQIGCVAFLKKCVMVYFWQVHNSEEILSKVNLS